MLRAMLSAAMRLSHSSLDRRHIGEEAAHARAAKKMARGLWGYADKGRGSPDPAKVPA